MTKKRRQKSQPPSDIELDVAPLLSIMVMLIPVLLLSAAFVQLMVIETDIPQAVSEAIRKERTQENPVLVSLHITQREGVQITVVTEGNRDIHRIGRDAEGQLLLKDVHAKLKEVKDAHPQVFRIQVYPASDVPYREIVQVLDEARMSRNGERTWPVAVGESESESENLVYSPYMFPDVVFANVLEG